MRILLKGFTADGINEPSRMAVLVENDRIIAVEKDIYGSCAADKIIEFNDEVIAPGFIDAHGHSDISILAHPKAESKRFQGITCEITGNCGLSAFPITPMNKEHLENLYSNYGIPLSWDDLNGYYDTLRKSSAGLRIYSLCGHNTLRSAVAGYEKKEISSSELNEMESLLRQSLSCGTPGLSTGLLYTPGCFAQKAEITALMRVLAEYDAVYATHLRSEGDHLLESLEETLSAARESGLKKVLISHLKTAGKCNWHKLPAALKLIDDYRAKGIDIRFDRYPYTESQTMLSVILPPPFDTMPDRDITIKLQDPALREKLYRQLAAEKTEEDWQRWRITGTTHPEWKNFIGKKYSELPGNVEIAVIDQLAFDAVTATIGAAGMSQKNMLKIITHPLCMGGSDGNALTASAKTSSHPRAFGAIAKFIRIKLDHGESIGSTINKVTASPAQFFSLKENGLIRNGKKADLCIFSPEEIDSKADFTSPCRLADGIRLTMLDGKIEYYF